MSDSFKQTLRAFTLIELLVVLAIMSILLLQVLPGYQNMTVKAQRSEGQAQLLEIQSQLERYYFQYHAYPEKLSALKKFSEDRVSSEHDTYQISLASHSDSCPAGVCFELLAEHRSGREEETLSLSSSGTKLGPW
ncbi:MAG: type IV pilin protein [Oleiphilus sp.]